MIPFEPEDVRRVAAWLGKPTEPGGEELHIRDVRAELIRCDTEDDWLTARLGGLGASEIGAVLGLSTWASPYALWYRKRLGWRLPRTEQQRWGHLVEDPIAELFAEARPDLYVVKPLGAPYSLWRDRHLPWMICTPDRLAVDPDGRVVPVEIKSDEGGTWGASGTDEVPPAVRAQLLWQAHIFGAHGGYITRKRGSGKAGLAWYWVPYDPAEVAPWIEVGNDFLTSIEHDDPPEPDGSRATTDTLKEIHPAIDAGDVAEVAGTLQEEWRTARLDKGAAARREAEASNQLRAAMGRAEFGAVRGEVFVKRRIGKRQGYEVGPAVTDELRQVGDGQRQEDGSLQRAVDPGADPGAAQTSPKKGDSDGSAEGTGVGGGEISSEGGSGKGRVTGSMIPHRWDGTRWTCLICGQTHPDPCGCPCHDDEANRPVVDVGAAPSFTCPECGMTSHNPNDAAWRYCGACHKYQYAELDLPAELAALVDRAQRKATEES